MRIPTLLLTGTVAAGKSTIAAEINDVLAMLKVPNAALDLDALTWQWPPSSKWNSDLMFQNLATVWQNYFAHGATSLVLARVLEDPTELARYREAIADADITTCRLVAPRAVRIERLMDRMPQGASREWHLRRTDELDAILEQFAHEDFVVENDNRPVRDVAVEVLTRAGWLSQDQTETLGRRD